MRKLFWLLALLILPMFALKLDAPRWISMLSAAPIFIFAMLFDDTDDDQSEGVVERLRPWILAVVVVGGLILGAALLLWGRALM